MALVVMGLAAAAPAVSAMEVDRFVDADGYEDIAVYEATGALYAADEAGDRIVRLSSGGTPELIWGKDVIAGNSETGYEICDPSADQCKDASEGNAKGELINPSGVAVDQSDGSVYVWDTRSGNSAPELNVRVQKFDADGNFVLMFGKGVNADTGGDVCTEVSGDECQAGVDTTDPGGFGNTTNNRPTLAVSPTDGDVFVADPGRGSSSPNRRVQRFESDGTFVEVIGSSANFGSDQPRHVAVDSQGIVYASDSNGSGQIDRYDSAGVHGAPGFLSSIAAPPLLAGSAASATVGLEVDPDPEGDGAAGSDTDHLYVLRDPSTGNTVVQQFDSPGEVAAPAAVADTHGNAAGFGAVLGLGLNTASGDLYITSSSGIAGQGVFILDDDGTGTDIGASDVAGTNATSTSIDLVGTVDPDEGLVRYRFLYSADGLNYTATPFQNTDVAGQVSHQLTGLDPNNLYRVRLEVEKILGPTTVISARSADSITSTAAAAPEATTLGSAHRTATSVQLRATVDPNGSDTTYRFEYGPDGGTFSGRIPIPDALVGSGNTASLVTQQLAGLTPNTAYHYRVVATNPSGTSTGAPVSFRTAPAAAARPSLGARAYELVSPADKVGGSGIGVWGGGLMGAAAHTGQAARRGERFAVSAILGGVLLDSAAAYAEDWAFAERTPKGWVSHSPITHAPSRDQNFKFIQLNAANEDLSTVVWGPNGDLLRVFPELAGWPGLNAQFVGDWAGRWELLAPTDLSQVYSTSVDGGAPVTKPVISADGSSVVATANLANTKAAVGGMAGSGDPAHPSHGDLVAGRVAYIDDVSAGLSDRFVGNGRYSNIGVCAGGTVLPERLASGALEDRPCPAPLLGRDARLISDRGGVVHASKETFEHGNSVENVVSRDGSRVFFLSPDPAVSVAAGVPATGCTDSGEATVCAPQLYVRQRNQDGSVTTRWISRAEDGLFGSQDAALTGPVRFSGASVDGDKVFFQTTSPLTADDPNGTGAPPPPGGVTTGTASNSSWDLYMYDLPDGPNADPGEGTLTRLSAGPTGTADCNVVSGASEAAAANKGALRFVADDGSRAYFTCAAPLGGVGTPSSGAIAGPAGTPASTDATNLYAYGASGAGASWRFVARLPQVGKVEECATTANRRAGLLGPLSATTQVGFTTGETHCVRGTADGAFVTFWTTARLTLDDPDSASVDGYAYDAGADELTRITAPQGGAGGAYPCGSTGPAATTACHGDSFGGANAEFSQLGVATEPAVAGDRIAFFHTRSRLVPEDVDDAYDVYQWRNGELELLSTGNSPGGGAVGGTGGAFYQGNDVSGRNVYIATNDKLTWQDSDAVQDIYTARIGGGIPQPPPPPICDVLSGGCHGGDAGAIAAPTTTSAVTRDDDVVTRDDDVVTRRRATLSIGRIGTKVRRRAARTGVLALRVRATRAGRVSVVARGKLGNRPRLLGRAAKRVAKPGVTRIRVRLNRRARRALKAGRRLRVTVRVRQAGARPRSTTVRLARGARS